MFEYPPKYDPHHDTKVLRINLTRCSLQYFEKEIANNIKSKYILLFYRQDHLFFPKNSR